MKKMSVKVRLLIGVLALSSIYSANASSDECDSKEGIVPQMICQDEELKALDMDYFGASYYANRVAPDSVPGDYGFLVRRNLALTWRNENCKTKECIKNWFDLQTQLFNTYTVNHTEHPSDTKDKKRARLKADVEEYMEHPGAVHSHKDWQYDSIVKPHVLTTKDITQEMQLILRTDDDGFALLNKSPSSCKANAVKVQFSKKVLFVTGKCVLLENTPLVLTSLTVNESDSETMRSELRRGKAMQVSFVGADKQKIPGTTTHVFSLMGYSAAGERHTINVYGIDVSNLNKITRLRELPDSLFARLGDELSVKTKKDRDQLLAASPVKSPVQPTLAAAQRAPSKRQSRATQNVPDVIARYAAGLAAQMEQAWHPACAAYAQPTCIRSCD